MKRMLGFLAVAGLLMIATPAQKAEAAVMAPGIAPAMQSAPESLVTEVQYRRRGYSRRYYAPRRVYSRRYYAPRRAYAPRVYVPRIRIY